MITAQIVIIELANIEPSFIPYMRKGVHLWLRDNGEISFNGIFNSLSNYTLDDLKGEHSGNYGELFILLEKLMASDDAVLVNAIATCFVENLQNASDVIDPILWVPYTGPMIKNCARSWDKLTGVKTVGL